VENEQYRDVRRKQKKTQAVNELIIDRRFQVAKKGKDLYLIKMVAKRPVTIVLRDYGNGYFIEPPSQSFCCSYSHFEFTEPEQRFTRRKDILLHLVEHLQKTRIFLFPISTI
jgi:hypothetical protein